MRRETCVSLIPYIPFFGSSLSDSACGAHLGMVGGTSQVDGFKTFSLRNPNSEFRNDLSASLLRRITFGLSPQSL